MEKEEKDERITKFKAALRKIIDPEIRMSIVDLGMVQRISVKGDSLSLNFVPTSPFCPIVSYFVKAINDAGIVAGFKDCKVNVVMPELQKFPKKK